MKKIMTISVILILYLLTFVSSISALYENKTIYVDDDGGVDYTSIQDAIDNANQGDTIFVYKGTYYEHIFINKTISIIGEDANATIITSLELKDVMQIFNANYVTVSGFSIQNTLPYNGYLAGIYIKNASNTLIGNTIITGCYDGILLKSSHNTISNNIIKFNKNGICFGHYRSDLFFCNVGNYAGNYLFSHNDNNISRNEIACNYETGITLTYTQLNTITENTLLENRIGINLRDCKDNVIQHNNFLGNNLQAFDMSVNHWQSNYWDDWIGLKSLVLRVFPYVIPGTLFFNIDMNPAAVPYNW